MSIRFSCPHCQSLLLLPDDCGGRATKCPNCGDNFVIPGSGTPSDPTPICAVLAPVEGKVTEEDLARAQQTFERLTAENVGLQVELSRAIAAPQLARHAAQVGPAVPAGTAKAGPHDRADWRILRRVGTLGVAGAGAVQRVFALGVRLFRGGRNGADRGRDAVHSVFVLSRRREAGAADSGAGGAARRGRDAARCAGGGRDRAARRSSRRPKRNTSGSKPRLPAASTGCARASGNR